MSLPFLDDSKKMATAIVAHRKKNGSVELSHEEGQHSPEIMSAAEDLIRHVHAKHAPGVASAIQNLVASIPDASDQGAE